MGTGVPQRGGMKGKEEDVLKKKRERERALLLVESHLDI